MNIFKSIDDVNREDYILVNYWIKSKTTLRDAAWNLAIGQSVGNPNVRNSWETDELFEKHSCIIIGDENSLADNKEGMVWIGFPVVNTNLYSDGISHLLCQFMGGHLDIDIIDSCSLEFFIFPESVKNFFDGPKYGISGVREFTKQYDKPLFGAIIKPKIGIAPNLLLDMVKQLVDAGVDFIKEDEIMSNPFCCPLDVRVDMIANYMASQSRNVIICHTVNCDPHMLCEKVETVHKCGGNGVHINVFSGLGSYYSIRQMNLPLFIHFQKSGDKLFTNASHAFNITWGAVCQLATMMGVDTIQAGMIGGYSNDDEVELEHALQVLRDGNVLPALSCGMHPGLVNKVTSIVGVDYMANVGGAIHGHPGGTYAGAKAMRDAIDSVESPEYLAAIDKWGLEE